MSWRNLVFGLCAVLPLCGAHARERGGIDIHLPVPSIDVRLPPPPSIDVKLPAPPAVYVEVEPPPPRRETVPPPRRGHHWRPGYWRWERNRHIWVPGGWIRVQQDSDWVADRWEEEDQGWRYVPGHWERRGARERYPREDEGDRGDERRDRGDHDGWRRDDRWGRRDEPEERGGMSFHVPPDRVPARGRCKVWFRDVPPDRQPPSMSCGKARADAREWGGMVIWARGPGSYQDGRVQAEDFGRHGLYGVPPDRLPPPGACRVWRDHVPPDRQSPPESCRSAQRYAREEGGRVLYMPGPD